MYYGYVTTSRKGNGKRVCVHVYATQVHAPGTAVQGCPHGRKCVREHGGLSGGKRRDKMALAVSGTILSLGSDFHKRITRLHSLPQAAVPVK